MPLRSLPRRLQLRRGAVAPLAVLCLALLVGVAALAIDGGTLMESRRHVQAAADAAALAGASDLFANYITHQGIDVGKTAQSNALTAASANGFSNDGVQSTVTVNTSPQTYQGGPNVGQTIPPGYIEVLIQYNAPPLFSGVFGAAASPIRARAVARGRSTPLSFNGLLALNLTASEALKVTGAGGLAVKGGIGVNSNHPQAVQVTGLLGLSATQLSLNPVAVTDGLLNQLLSLLGGTVSSIVTSPPIPDPLRYLPVPDPTSLTTRGNNLIINSGIVNLYPGIYNGGIQISGFATVILHANSDGTPGIYYLNGQNGLRVTNFALLTTAIGETAGVMIYNNWSDSNDAIYVNDNGVVSITPPASGLYRGLSIFQKRGGLNPLGPTVTITGSGAIKATGTIYAAHAAVSLSGSSLLNTMGGQIIADTISATGSVKINIDPGTAPVANQRYLGLVE